MQKKNKGDKSSMEQSTTTLPANKEICQKYDLFAYFNHKRYKYIVFDILACISDS